MHCITNETEHVPSHQYEAWAWPEYLHYLQPKKTKVRLLAVYMIAKGIISAVHY